MNLQELIGQTDLDLNEGQVRAFFLGALSADRPLPFNKAQEELLSEAPETKNSLEPHLKQLWDKLNDKDQDQLASLFADKGTVQEFLTTALERLDYFLTGLSLAGSLADEEQSEVLDELENVVMDLDEYLSDDKPETEAGEELKEQFLGAWEELVKLKKG